MKKLLQLVGVTGIALSGKDTFVSVLTKSGGFMRTAFADPVKDAAAAIYGVPREMFEGSFKMMVDPFWGVTYRKMAQLVGTECVRNVLGFHHWVTRAKKEYVGLSMNVPFIVGVVLSDVRFENEAE